MSTSAPVPTPSVDEFARFQQLMAHILGHPRLRDAVGALSEMAEDEDPKAQLLEMGFALPDDATVKVDVPATDEPHPTEYHICVGESGGHAHCVHFTLPEIHIHHF